ncbi:MAG: RluA family pseudouridine synthase [Prevotella sp.]|nr:RluA family pseudouridine synthase [Prevotella sp.]
MDTPLHPLCTDIAGPERFTYPFDYQPHALCQLAAQEVQAYIGGHAEINNDADRGKMYGVLVVESGSTLFFLAAYSGLLAGRNDWPYFVPPVYDAQQPDGHFKQQEREISLTASHSPLVAKKMSQDLQLWLFHQYRMLNARGEERDLVDIWQDYYNRPKLLQHYPLPPGGTGDCCAPKLLQYAYQHQLKPLCMAEFWWGQPTREEVRRHLNYYPACRGKCKPILTWMLQGLDVDPSPEVERLGNADIPILYEDQWIAVVDKPTGLLSVPGRTSDYCLQTILQQRWPEAFVCHRLDMGTSGLMIVAKLPDVYANIQQQFIKHEVRKKYIAILDAPSGLRRLEGAGRISLPLRPDHMNRPRQIVDMEHGKQAITDYEMLGDNIVVLYPETGRTHQLRMHCAHPEGLGRPIVGDELYGTRGERLMLHAAELWFRHPVTGEPVHIESAPPFPQLPIRKS